MKTSPALSHRLLPFLLALAALTLSLAPSDARGQSETLTDYVLIANKVVRFGRSCSVASGNVGVSAAASAGGGVLFAGRSMVTGDGTHLVSDTAELRGPGSIYSLFANSATIASSVVLRVPCGGGACSFPPPVLLGFPAAAAISPGTTPVNVPARTTVTLPAGDYGTFTVRGRSTVVFTGGVYNFSEFKTSRVVRLLFTAPTTINVAGRLQFGSVNLVGPIGPGARPQDVLFQVAGDRVRIKPRTTVSARISAPSSLLLVGYGGLIKGQLIADQARLDKGVVLQSSFPIGPFEVRTNTPTQTAVPTSTLPPTNTPIPTNTPAPTNTPTPSPVNTQPPTAPPTDTPELISTSTATAVPQDTATQTAIPTDTAVPNTPTSPPTATATLPGGCSGAISLEASGYEQVSFITQILGGTVTQIGGTSPGAAMSNAASFQGTVDTQSGVSVSLPGYLFASSAPAFDLSGNAEPGNVAAVILGGPTDLTFTTPGAGGPDGTDGDGSLVMASGSNFVTLGFGSTVCTGTCSPRSLVLFTDTAGSGTAQIELLLNGSPVASMTATFAGGAPGSGMGGAAFNLDNVTFDQVMISRLSGTVEIDAVAVKNAGCGGGELPLVICGDGTREGGEECDDGNTLNNDGCSSDCRNEYDLLNGLRYCTLSQGGWAGPDGSAFFSREPALLPVTIGGPSFSTTIHTQAALAAYLPKGGTPHILLPGERQFHTAVDVDDDGAGVLGGQTVALSLAVSLSSSGEVFENLSTQPLTTQPFCTQGLLAGSDGLIGTGDDVLDAGSAISAPWSLPSSVVGTGNTVGDVLMMANQYLRGAGGAPSISDVNSAVNTVNLAFDGCRQVVPCP